MRATCGATSPTRSCAGCATPEPTPCASRGRAPSIRAGRTTIACTGRPCSSSTTTRRTRPTTSTRSGTTPATISAWTCSAPITRADITAARSSARSANAARSSDPRSHHGHRERQGAHVRCLRHRGGLALEPDPRGRGPRQEKRSRRRLGEVRRRLARALPAGDGRGPQRPAPVDQARRSPSREPRHAPGPVRHQGPFGGGDRDRKSTRLNSSHVRISYAVFCLKKKKKKQLSFRFKKKNNNKK